MANSVARVSSSKMEIAEGLPKADEQSQEDSQRLKRAFDVVAKKFRIAEDQDRFANSGRRTRAASGKSGSRSQVEREILFLGRL